MTEIEMEYFVELLNDIESVVEKHGWNIGVYQNFSNDKDYSRIEITLIPAIGYDSQFRKFGAGLGETE